MRKNRLLSFRSVLTFLLVVLGVASLVNIPEGSDFKESVSTPAVAPEEIEQAPAAPSAPTREPEAQVTEPPAVVASQPVVEAAPSTALNAFDALFKTARLLDERAELVSGERRRISLWQTDYKYPLLRVVDSYRTNPASGEEALVDREVMAAGHAMVRFPVALDEAAIQQWLAARKLELVRELHTPGLYLIGRAEPSLDTVLEIIEAFDEDFSGGQDVAQLVAVAEPDYLVYPLLTPNDPSFSLLYGLHNTGQTGGLADADIDAVEAWDLATGSRSVLIGVLDTGVDRDHPDLLPNMWTNPGEIADNGLDDDGNGFIDDVHGWDFYADDKDPTDVQSHGTHVAGTIGAAGANAMGVVGVNFECSMVGIQILSPSGPGSISDAVDGVHYATNLGVSLTCNSWGGGGYSTLLRNAIEAADTAGILFVAAAGNNGRNNEIYGHYPSSYPVDNVIAVASSDHRDLRSSFSNYGVTTVDLAAPGSLIYSTMPGGGYAYKSGTSMATPQVAGAIALMKAVAPAMSAPDLKAALLNSVDALPAFASNTVSGGRLNLHRALQGIAGPVLLVSDVSFDDSTGNGDGIFNPGETIVITCKVKNEGTDPTQGVNAALSGAGNANFVLTDAAESVGSLAAGQELVLSAAFSVAINAGTSTPDTESLTITLTDDQSNQWTHTFDLLAQTSSTISGTVRTKTAGDPIAGATVHYRGPVSGSVTTDAAGAYSFAVTDGTYRLNASATGYFTGLGQSVTVPPSQADVDFELIPPIPVTPGKLLPADPLEWAEFGYSVSISGNVAIVGAYNSFKSTIDSGLAYIFRDDGSGWVQEKKLFIDAPAMANQFGFSVSISGDVAVVGAPADTYGYAYVYRYDGTDWLLEQTLEAPIGDFSNDYGVSVCVSGDRLIVGARRVFVVSGALGEAHIYRYDGSQWQHEAELEASDGVYSDQFGHSVSISGDRALVAANRSNPRGVNSGAVYAFGWNGTQWTQEAKLVPGDGASDDQFGFSLSLDGDLAVIGALFNDDPESNAGSAYVFRHNGTAWQEEAKLLASDGALDRRFGNAVSISGNQVLVGSFFDDNANGNEAGATYVFAHDGSQWVETQKLLADDGQASDSFGQSVALSGNAVIVGANRNVAPYTASGAAYIFDLTQPTGASVNGYLGWQADYFSEGESGAGFDEDWDGDGLSNALEFLFNTDPKARSNMANVLRIEAVSEAGIGPLSGGGEQRDFTLQYTRNDVVGDAPIRYEFSSNLTDWTTAVQGTHYLQQVTDNGDGTETVTLRFIEWSEGSFYVRLRLRSE